MFWLDCFTWGCPYISLLWEFEKYIPCLYIFVFSLWKCISWDQWYTRFAICSFSLMVISKYYIPCFQNIYLNIYFFLPLLSLVSKCLACSICFIRFNQSKACFPKQRHGVNRKKIISHKYKKWRGACGSAGNTALKGQGTVDILHYMSKNNNNHRFKRPSKPQ